MAPKSDVLSTVRRESLQHKESQGFQILRAIRRIIRRTSEHSRNVGKQSGVSVPQMLCLKAIADFPADTEVTVVMVANAVQLSAATVSRILDRLENVGLILRERRSTDRRKVCLSLTEAGKQKLDDLPTPLHEQFLERLNRLDASERRGLLKALERIVELMDAEGLDASPMLTPELNVGPGQPATTRSDASNDSTPPVKQRPDPRNAR